MDADGRLAVKRLALFETDNKENEDLNSSPRKLKKLKNEQ